MRLLHGGPRPAGGCRRFSERASVLVHRLPLTFAPLGAAAAEPSSWQYDRPTHFSPHRWAWLLTGCDLACVLAAGWLFLTRGGHIDPVRLQISLCAFAALWLLLAGAIGLYRPATLQAGLEHALLAMSCLAAVLTVEFYAASRMVPAARFLPPLLPQLRTIMLAALAVRLAWQAWLWLMLLRGACLYRIVVLAESVASARFFAAAIERRTGGRLRATACGTLTGISGTQAAHWMRSAIPGNGVDRVVMIDRTAHAAGDAAGDYCTVAQVYFAQMGIRTIRLPLAAAAAAGWYRARHEDPAMAGLHDFPLPLSDGQATLKRVCDIAMSSAGIILSAPLLLIIAAAIKADSRGPVLFRQERVGLHGSGFPMWKFRTMHNHLQDASCRLQTSRGDLRVTRLGKFLRRSSLDELPQLFNVLRGDMSMVGPRPHAIDMTVAGHDMTTLVQGYADRHAVKPGITGWAQVKGCRGELDHPRKLRRRVALDCHYIENWSLMTDVGIILRTVALLIRDRHAY